MTNQSLLTMLDEEYSNYFQIMNIAKLILLASGVVFASMLVGNSAQASILTPGTPHLTVASAQPIPASTIPQLTEKSNPIMDQLGCNCPTCVQARMQMQGKLQLENLL